MGKLKTNKSIRKRVRITKSGKIKKMRAGKRHLLESKSSKRRRQMRGSNLVTTRLEKQIKRLMPYGE